MCCLCYDSKCLIGAHSLFPWKDIKEYIPEKPTNNSADSYLEMNNTLYEEYANQPKTPSAAKVYDSEDSEFSDLEFYDAQ